MGKSAGNLPIELISMYMNTVFGRNFNVSQMLEAIDISIMPFFRKSPWGYNLFFYISASNNCHPNYVRFLMDKHTLSLKSINTILDAIEPEKNCSTTKITLKHCTAGIRAQNAMTKPIFRH